MRQVKPQFLPCLKTGVPCGGTMKRILALLFVCILAASAQVYAQPPPSSTPAGVSLQSSTPGTAQTGNFNISGTGIMGAATIGPTGHTGSITEDGSYNMTFTDPVTGAKTLAQLAAGAGGGPGTGTQYYPSYWATASTLGSIDPTTNTTYVLTSNGRSAAPTFQAPAGGLSLSSPITGFVSGAGTVGATDTLLAAIDKLDGNTAAKAPLANPIFTGTVNVPSYVSTTAGLEIGGVQVQATAAQINYLDSAGGTTGTTSTNVVFSTSPIVTTPELIGEYYDEVTQSPTGTGTVTINAATTGKALITPSTASQADTIAFSNQPAANKVRYIRVQIIAPASGTQTIVWPTSNFYWLGGTSGILTALSANKHYEYACELESTNIYCSIISEGIY